MPIRNKEDAEELCDNGRTLIEYCDYNGSEVSITTEQYRELYLSEERAEDGQVVVTATYFYDNDNFMRECEMIDGQGNLLLEITVLSNNEVGIPVECEATDYVNLDADGNPITFQIVCQD